MALGHSSATHRNIRKRQAENHDEYHHPEEKIAQLKELDLSGEILEVFAGQGNLTKFYETKGNVTPLSKNTTGDSFHYIYKLRADRKKYDVIDVDSYGYPDKFFPLVFEMMKDEAYLIFTFPIVGVNALNGIMEQHFVNYWRSTRPTTGDVVGVLTDQALRGWQLLSLVDVQKIKRIWRFVFKVKRIKATEMTNVRNR